MNDADTKPIGYLPAYELGRLHSGHNANLRSAKFGPSPLDGDVPVYLAPPAEAVRQPLTDADADAVTDEYRKGFIDGQISINPLTEAQIADVMHEADWPPAILPPVIKSKLRQLARAIERAHGITGAQE